MRPIKYRAKRIDIREWVYGLPFMTSFSTTKETGLQLCIQVIEDINYKTYEVDPETLCEFTGIKTVNQSMIYDESKEIYEDDVFRLDKDGIKYKVTFKDGCWQGISDEGDMWGYFSCFIYQDIIRKSIMLIGNIHDS